MTATDLPSDGDTGSVDDAGTPEDGRLEDGPPSGLPVPGAVGALVVVGTPIGNLGDLSPRAVATLASADVLYAEDTRHSRKLLSHAGITGVPLRSLHEHNEADRVDEVVAAVAAGRTVALVSDAGMPAVSDPGARVAAAVAAAGLTVTVVPGPSAVLAALVSSGLATDRFCFEGFLPRSGRDRADRLAALAAEPRTSVLFEAPGRVAATLADLAAVCGGDRPVAVARELTKLHEEVWRGTLEGAAAWAADGLRGEVVLVAGRRPASRGRRGRRGRARRRADGGAGRGCPDPGGGGRGGGPPRRAPPPGLRAGPPPAGRVTPRPRTRNDRTAGGCSRPGEVVGPGRACNAGPGARTVPRSGRATADRATDRQHHRPQEVHRCSDAAPTSTPARHRRSSPTTCPRGSTGPRSPPAASGGSRSSSSPSRASSTPSRATRAATSTSPPTSRCARAPRATPRPSWSRSTRRG